MLLVAGAASYVASMKVGGLVPAGLLTFESEYELYDFLDTRRGTSLLGGGSDFLFGTLEGAQTLGGDYSTTNVQVEGVDESDIVKTDGKFLYVATGDGVFILRAFPPDEMTLLSVIPVDQLAETEANSVRVQGLFLLEELLIILSTGDPWIVVFEDLTKEEGPWSPPEAMTHIAIFDVSDAGSPILLDRYAVSGSLKTSRMTNGHLYIVSQSPILRREDGYSLPRICRNSGCEAFDLDKILYDPDTEFPSVYSNLLALNPLEGTYGYLSIIAGHVSTVYMSRESLYVTFTRPGPGILPGQLLPLGFSSVSMTSIYKIRTAGTELSVAASGAVSGRLLNQFSMDEKDGYLRVVTTVGWTDSKNNVYVLDDGLEVVGLLEGLAPRESVYSARFLGDVLYLVTFKKVDHFFVIDLSDPGLPRVLGHLKIPGFSQYLHPLGEGYILGVGKDTVEAEEGDFAWFQGLKLSLFDATDPAKPGEVAKYTIGVRGTTSEVLTDHKAFLYIPSRGLIVIPVDLTEYEEGLLERWKDPGEGPPPFVTGKRVWQGVYVLSVSPQEGFQLIGRISHLDLLIDGGYDTSLSAAYTVTRSLYIGDYLYTISESIVGVNSLVDLSLVGYLVYSTVGEAMTKA
jgi:uncharacterized secreted protein with C-terminal beta-propeller domain